jgi:hypothetical protein
VGDVFFCQAAYMSMTFAQRADAMASLAALDTVNGGRAPGPPGALQVSDP